MLERIVFNADTSKVRIEKLEGRDHYVVPTVMIVEGVLKGSNGSLYYPKEQLRKNPQAWDMRPVVVFHPQKNGKPVSAASVPVINTQKIGLILNTKFEIQKTKKGKARLKSEAWIDIEKTKEVRPDLIEKIKNGDPVEVSTGLYTENEAGEGEYDGKKYDATAKDFVPDHLAILPEGVGACSVADGAGLNVNAEGGTCPGCGGKMSCPSCSKPTTNSDITVNAMSYNRVHQTIQKGLDERYGQWQTGVKDVYPGFVIYGKRSGDDYKLFKMEYKIDNRKENKVSLTGDPSEVEMVTEYRTPDGTFVGNALYGVQPEENAVTKDQLIDKLIANSEGKLDKEDKEWLSKKSEEWLNKVFGGTTTETTPVNNSAPVVKVPTFQEIIANADPATRDMINEGLASRAAEREKMVKGITANAKNKFTPEQLNAFDTPTLRNLYELAVKEEPVVNRGPVYAGAGGFVPTVNASGETVMPSLPMPPTTAPKKG